ncbi:MAG: IS982 family transposase, partial [Romboutsia sp.]
MLELNNYYIQELENLTDLFTSIFIIVDDIYNEIIPISITNRRNAKDSKLCDSEIVTISIVGELLTIDLEKAFLSLLKREYKILFPSIGDRTRFNRTKRNLHWVLYKIREYISSFMQSYSNDIRVVDSMPIPVCEFRRAHFSKCFKGEASYGRCSSKNMTYFGFKFHALITVDGFVTDYVITPANIDDRNAVWDLCNKYSS